MGVLSICPCRSDVDIVNVDIDTAFTQTKSRNAMGVAATCADRFFILGSLAIDGDVPCALMVTNHAVVSLADRSDGDPTLNVDSNVIRGRWHLS